MKINELINISLSYLASAALMHVLLRALGYNKPAIALAAAAVVGTDVAAWFYRKGQEGPASIRFRLHLALLLAGLCLAESAGFQILLHWMAHPVTTTAVATGGTFVFPLVMFEGLRSRIGSRKRRPSR